MQTDYVKNNFDINLFAGLYYEIAFHDYTQDPGCPFIRCVRSVKSYIETSNIIYDNFTLHCVGQVEQTPFIFNLTEIPGFFNGILNKHPNIEVWPDTVVAVGPIITYNNTKQYQWVIEIQCLYKTELGISEIIFVGLNFYCHYNDCSETIVNDMINTAKQQGLGIYMDPLYYVNQTDCTYP